MAVNAADSPIPLFPQLGLPRLLLLARPISILPRDVDKEVDAFTPGSHSHPAVPISPISQHSNPLGIIPDVHPSESPCLSRWKLRQIKKVYAFMEHAVVLILCARFLISLFNY